MSTRLPGSGTRANVFPIARQPSTAARSANHEQAQGATDEKSDAAELLLPVEVELALGRAVQNEGFRLAPQRTNPMGDDDVRFQTIHGLTASGPGCIALLYVSDEELQAHPERWYVYSLCVRVCKVLRGLLDLRALLFLRPSHLRFPDSWKEQIENFGGIGAVPLIAEVDIGAPSRWARADVADVRHYVRDWVRKAALDPVDPPATELPRPLHSAAHGTIGAGSATDNSSSVTQPWVFVSYAHKDDPLCRQLCEALNQLESTFKQTVWVDKMIPVGGNWEPEIETRLAAAKVVVLLVTQAFINSEFIRTKEMNVAVEAASREEKTIVWVCGESCGWKDTAVKPIQAAHDVKRPLRDLPLPKRKQQLNAVYECVRDLLRDKYGAPLREE